MNLKIFCTSIYPYNLLNKLPEYIQPLGLGEREYSNTWYNEKSGENIRHLNKYYGELTGFYWIWKNVLENFSNNDLIGFCHYRKLWLNFLLEEKNKYSIKSVYEDLLNLKNQKLYKAEVFQVQPIIFSKKNLFEDFENVHQNNILKFSLDFLDEPIRSRFTDYLNNNVLYPLNMFISKKIFFEDYCNILFPWMKKCFDLCEKKKLLVNYNIRLPAFLAERFTSFWFSQFEKRELLSYARLGSFFLSEKINKFFNPLKIPFTTRIYPTIHYY